MLREARKTFKFLDVKFAAAKMVFAFTISENIRRAEDGIRRAPDRLRRPRDESRRARVGLRFVARRYSAGLIINCPRNSRFQTRVLVHVLRGAKTRVAL
jgi:hypothetical protein